MFFDLFNILSFEGFLSLIFCGSKAIELIFCCEISELILEIEGDSITIVVKVPIKDIDFFAFVNEDTNSVFAFIEHASNHVKFLFSLHFIVSHLV